MKKSVLSTLFVLLAIVTSQAAVNHTEIRYLSGTGFDDTVDWEFYCSEGRKSEEWSTIPVPSCWELKGFGEYNYGKDPFEERVNEHGLYRYEFKAPKEWADRDVKIVFEGVMTDAEVKINGELAGEIHQGAFYEFKYDITELLKYGQENVLEVKVDKASSNESINEAERNCDFWIFGGIYRPVYLQAFPKDHIERVAIDAKANGEMLVDAYVDATQAGDLRLQLQNLDGKKLNDLDIGLFKKDNGKWSVTTEAKNIKTWNPESPQLYNLQLELIGHKGEVLHRIQQRIGFRTVEILESDGVYVNGERIKFKGVNRHSFHPKYGRTTSKSLSYAHIKMMKDMNMNAVRMSHYPPDVHFLDACDELGLFVIDEVCTWHSPHLDTDVGEKIVKETVIRDVNHPSIVIWANGNETGWNTDLDDDYAKWDIQQREVIHPWNVFQKTNTLHYPKYHALAYDGPNKDKVTFHTEFLHGLYDGGHGAGLEDYWSQIWNKPLAAGGFLWVFADEAVVRTDKDGAFDTAGNQAPDGITGPYGEKEGSYFTIKEVWSPIYIEDRYIRDDFNGIFRIENRYHFTNFSDCSMTAKWVKFEDPTGLKKERTLSSEKIKLPDLAPGEKGKFHINIPKKAVETADALHITATGPDGLEVFTWSYPARHPQQVNEDLLGSRKTGKFRWQRKGDLIIVNAKDVEFTFADENGKLLSVKKKGKLIPLANGPIILGQKDAVKFVRVLEAEDEESVDIEVTFETVDKYDYWDGHEEMVADFMRWTVHSTGLLDLHVENKVLRRNKDYKGITFSFPEAEVEGMKWLGDGPYRVWRNRMKGTRYQVWENKYNDTVTGESGWSYPEFKGFFSSLTWANVKGNDNNGFTVYCKTPHVFLRMLTPKQPAAPKDGATVKDFPEGDISFVVNIPGIGTKFKKIGETGPQSNPENIFGNVDEPLVIDLTFEF